MTMFSRKALSCTLRFSPDLEKEFESEMCQERMTHFTRCGLLGLFLYDFFLLYHWQLTPDCFALAAVLSLVLFTPMMLFAIFVLTRSRSVVVREASWTVMPIVAVLFMMVIASSSEDPHKSISFFSAVLVMIFTTAVQRLRLRYTVAANVGIMLVVVFTIVTATPHDPRTEAASLIFYAVASVLMFMAAYAFERETRLTYLAERQTRHLNEELKRASLLDPLTGLWNRRHLEILMASAWRNANQGTSRAILIIDIDHFKRINDAFGHAAGDTCLIEVARCLTHTVGDDAVVVRYGGEEFVVFLQACNAENAEALADRICANCGRHEFELKPDQKTIITLSIGVAATNSASDSAALMARADAALYNAKTQGRNRVGMAPPDDLEHFALVASRSVSLLTSGFSARANDEPDLNLPFLPSLAAI